MQGVILDVFLYRMESSIHEDFAILQELELGDLFSGKIFIQRDDLLHSMISGNKWRKLQGWINEYRVLGANEMVTFGGAYSNHLVATAAAGFIFDIPTIGILRGEEGFNNHYLELCKNFGMKVIPVSREVYKDKILAAQEFSSINSLIIPEGGNGVLGLCGFENLIEKWAIEPDVIYHASATATTAVGLAVYCKKKGWNTRIKAIMVIKNREEQELFAEEHGVLDSIDFISDYDFGGYAKSNVLLLDFINKIYRSTQIKLDPIYTGKAFYGMVQEEHKLRNSRAYFLHTGGELGRLSDRYKDLLFS